MSFFILLSTFVFGGKMESASLIGIVVPFFPIEIFKVNAFLGPGVTHAGHWHDASLSEVGADFQTVGILCLP